MRPAKQELDHALIISRQIDYLGKMPVVTPKPVRTSKNPKDMLRYDLENENETIRNYRDRIRQCEALGEFAMAEQIRQILMQEQDHQIDLATALGIEVPDVSGGPKRTPHEQTPLILLAPPSRTVLGNSLHTLDDGVEDVRTREVSGILCAGAGLTITP